MYLSGIDAWISHQGMRSKPVKNPRAEFLHWLFYRGSTPFIGPIY